jgi:hypothetical protein
MEEGVRIRRLLAMLALAVSITGLTIPLPAGAVAYRPTLIVLKQEIAASVGINAPDITKTIPPQKYVPFTNYGRINPICYNYSYLVHVPNNAQGHCALGDLTAARKIVVFGDSTALQWIPALSQLGTDLHWRIIFLGKPECSAWAYKSVAGTLGCRRYMHQVVTFVNTLHPRFVLPMGEKVAWLGSRSTTILQLRAEIGATLNGLMPSHSKVLLMETIPQFNKGYTSWNPSICFNLYYNNMNVCERVIRHYAVSSTTSVALWRLSIARHLHVIPVIPLFCHNLSCALFVNTPGGSYLVYKDATHMDKYYSNYIAHALEDEMRPLLALR